MRECWDLVIVGAGMIGALVLDKFRRLRPGASVLVIDRAAPAAGATGSSAGVCVPIAGVSGRALLVRPSQDYFLSHPEWREVGLVRPLDIWFVLRRRTLPSFLDAWLGEPPEPVAHLDAVLDHIGDLRIEPDELVIRSAVDCFVIDAGRLTDTLIDTHLAKPDTALWEGAEVIGIKAVSGGARVTLATGRCVNARTVAVATGGWRPPWPGSIPIVCPVKRIAALTVDHAAGGQLPMIDFIEDELFILPTRRNCLTVSFRRESFANVDGPLDLSATAADIEEGRELLARRSPQLTAAVVGARAGYDGYPGDGTPMVIIGGGGRVVGVGGMGGSGVRLGPAMADRAAAALSDALDGDGQREKYSSTSGSRR